MEKVPSSLEATTEKPKTKRKVQCWCSTCENVLELDIPIINSRSHQFGYMNPLYQGEQDDNERSSDEETDMETVEL
jgi:hypothetical protein